MLQGQPNAKQGNRWSSSMRVIQAEPVKPITKLAVEIIPIGIPNYVRSTSIYLTPSSILKRSRLCTQPKANASKGSRNANAVKTMTPINLLTILIYYQLQFEQQMSSFEELATDLTCTVHELRSKKEKLKKEIEEDELECERMESQLQILMERKNEIEGSVKAYKGEREELFTVITETEQTKKKIIESLKFLGANLKKYRPTDK